MSLKEFADSLNLPYSGDIINNEYIVDVDDSNKFSDLYTCISSNDNLKVVGNSLATVDESKFYFTNGEFQVNLVADFDNDIYRLSIEVR